MGTGCEGERGRGGWRGWWLRLREGSFWAKAAGAGWPDHPDAEPEVRGSDRNVRTNLRTSGADKVLIRDWGW